MPKKTETSELPENAGIFIIALGDPNYGRMAFNLAVSIKAEWPDVKIAVGFNEGSLRDLFRYPVDKYIDRLVQVPDEILMRRGHIEYQRAKLHILDLSPWESTLYLDADTIWLNNARGPAELMKSLAKVDLAIQNRGFIDLAKPLSMVDSYKYSTWAKTQEIKKAYNITKGKYYLLFSEMMWIRNTPENHALFFKAREIYDNLLVEYLEFNGGVPDELPLAIAIAIAGRQIKSELTPVYWEASQKRNLTKKPEELKSEFYALSIGGKRVSRPVEDYYNHLASYAFQREGLQYPYTYIDKRKFLPQRKAL